MSAGTVWTNDDGAVCIRLEGEPECKYRVCAPGTTEADAAAWLRRHRRWRPKPAADYREYKREMDQARQRLARENKARFVARLGARCMDCGITGDPIIFDFDHRDPIQKGWIPSKLMRCPNQETIEREIAKCDLVCSNCHRVRTRNGNHYTIRRAA